MGLGKRGLLEGNAFLNVKRTGDVNVTTCSFASSRSCAVGAREGFSWCMLSYVVCCCWLAPAVPPTIEPVYSPPGAKFRPWTVTTVPAPDTANDGTAAPLFFPNSYTPTTCASCGVDATLLSTDKHVKRRASAHCQRLRGVASYGAIAIVGWNVQPPLIVLVRFLFFASLLRQSSTATAAAAAVTTRRRHLASQPPYTFGRRGVARLCSLASSGLQLPLPCAGGECVSIH